MAVKIVHCGDLHIGACFSDLSREKQAVRRGEVFGAFSDIIRFCNEKEADMLLICGDLFDTPTPKKSDVNAVTTELKKLVKTSVYIICGNHDFLSSGGVFSQEGIFPENVYIFPSEGEVIENAQIGVRIFGASYSGMKAPSIKLPPYENGKINIAMLHGDMVSSSDYFTISQDTAAECGYEYLAFGHIHGGDIFTVGDTQCAYCTTPEPHGFDDNKRCGFVFTQIDENGTKCEFIRSAKRSYVHIGFDVGGFSSNDEIIEKLSSMLIKENLYRISLTGSFDQSFELSAQYILESIADKAFFVSVSNDTFADYNIELLLEDSGFRGIFLRRLRSMFTDDDKFLPAARAGLSALDGRSVDL